MSHHRDLDKFIDETRSSQRNIVFPDTVRNGRSVDVFFWRGSPAPTLVQRIAAWMFGLVFIAQGFLFGALAFNVGKKEDSMVGFVVIGLMSLALGAIGIRVFRNGFPRRTKSAVE
jgi:hypothetical protein